MEKILLELEKSFFKYEYISDRQWLSDILHPDFLECGKSGLLYTKEDTVEALLSCEEDRDIEILNFQWAQLAAGCFLVNYITESENIAYYRTSLWVWEDRLRLRFHQASGLSEKMVRKLGKLAER